MPRRRPQMTSVDYVVIALSPALIMALVGSLCFFLLAVFYRGQFEGRLNWIMFWFVLAAVLIARIAMEEGAEKASVYGLGLAGAVAVVLYLLIDSPFVAWALMAVVWWCAHKLTWDCTLIDDDQDASGQGLLQIAGLDPVSPDGQAAPAPPEPDEDESDERRRKPSWWERWLADREEKRKRPHAPGVWVVYFSLAALPLFGLGQAFIPADDGGRRRYAFLLLVCYVASGLGLLLTTSFLGLRRYLRQRKLEMPLTMTGTWLGVGAVLIVALLLFGMFVPRPSPEYRIEEVIAGALGSPTREASNYAVLRDGAGRGEGQASSNTTDQKSPNQETGHRAQGTDGGQQGQGQEGQGQQGQGQQGQGQQRQGQQGRGQQGQGQQGQGQEGQGQQGQGQQGQGQQGQGQQGQGQEGQGQQGQGQQGQGQQGQGQQGQGQEGQGQQGQGQQGQGQGQQGQGQQGQGQQGQGQQGQGQQGQGQQGQGQQGQGQQGQGQQAEGRQGQGQQGQARQGQQNQHDGEQKASQQGERMHAGSPPPRQRHNATSGSRGNSPPPPSARRMPRLPQLPNVPLAEWIRWLMYGVMLAAVIYGFLRYRQQVIAFLNALWAELLAILKGLFGRKSAPAAEEADDEPVAPPHPFAAFADPFATGAAARSSPDQLVRYTFDALQAWAFERGAGRRPSATPFEFTSELADRAPALAGDARRLAELFVLITYSRSTLSAECLPLLRTLWQRLRSSDVGAGV